jgi:diacylglycerol kinase (ATP)
MRTVAIVNPVSGRQQAFRKWPVLLRAGGSRAAHVVTWWTEGPGHAEVLAAQARREGFHRIIVAGGDGTLFEVVNGLWWETQGQLPSVGMVSFGMGCDYLRSFEVGASMLEELDTALGQSVVRVDVGVCQLQGLNGKPLQRVFVNVLGLGYDANVVRRIQRQRVRIHSRITYLFSALQELASLQSHRLQGEVNGVPFETDALLFAVGLGRYFGGGMMITPWASPQAGRFQLVWGGDLGRLELLGLLPKIYRGQHLYHRQVHSHFGHRLKLSGHPEAYVQVEGELIGRTPINVEVAPAKLCFAAGDTRTAR